MSEHKLPAIKQSELVNAAKHLLSLARAGRLTAIGYAVLFLDDDGDISSGSNAVWTDDVKIREELKKTLKTLDGRIAETSRIILQ